MTNVEWGNNINFIFMRDQNQEGGTSTPGKRPGCSVHVLLHPYVLLMNEPSRSQYDFLPLIPSNIESILYKHPPQTMVSLSLLNLVSSVFLSIYVASLFDWICFNPFFGVFFVYQSYCFYIVSNVFSFSDFN